MRRGGNTASGNIIPRQRLALLIDMLQYLSSYRVDLLFVLTTYTNVFMSTVTIYSTPSCVYCNLAKKFFTANSVGYTEYNVATDLDKRREMIDKTGQMGVPVIDTGKEIVIGFDEGRLKMALGLK